MPRRVQDPLLEEQRERDRRYGLEHDPYGEFVHELELADRIADQASLPPGHPLAHGAAQRRLGRGPYEQPHQPAPQQFAPGERVNHHDPQGEVRPGRVLRTHERDGLVEVDFGHEGSTLVAADQLGAAA